MIEKPKKERRFLKTLGRFGEILIQEVLIKIGSGLIKKIGGKRTLPSILFLLASLSLFAQYPNTGNKQRLGFQTTGDGLVWRGSLSDTASIQPINNTSAWVILDTINLKFYSFDFTSNVWNLVGGGSAAFTQPVDSLFFNTVVPTNNVDTAKMRWDFDLGTVVLGMYDQVPNELGFKNFWLVKNQTGSTITKGSIVYANGTVGASGRITVAKFIANGSIDAKYLLGITAHDLTDGEDGYVISFGKIRQVNTDTFAAGAILYPSPTVAGVWTDVEPVAPNIDMPIGFCINSSSNNGTIAIRVASGYKLNELHDVSITSPLEKSSLYYSGGLWRDTTAALLVSDTASMLLPYLRDADTSSLNLTSRFAAKLNVSDTASMLTPYLRKSDTTNMLLPYFRDSDTSLLNLTSRFAAKLNISDTSVFARDNQISGTSGQVAYFNSSNSVISDAGLIYNATNKSLGVNTTTTSGANLIIKNSQEPSRATVVATQTFAADTTNWTRGAGWTFNGAQAVATAATGDLTYTPSLTITSGNAYEITYTVTGYSAGALTVALGNASLTLPTHNATANVILLTPTSATGGFRFTTSTFTGNVDNVSIVEISNVAPVIFAGQDDASSTLYNSLRMPNSTTFAIGGGGSYTTGTNNLGIGANSLFLNTSGAGNTANGVFALRSNTTGNNNVAMGTNSLRFSTSANDNIAIGANALFTNTIGSNNVANGTSALQSNTTGGSNIAIGINALFTNTVGSNNIGIGANVGDNIQLAANGNVIIGNGIDFPISSGSNQVAIKNVYFATGASGTGTTIAALSKAGIKTNAPNRDLEVAGEVRITDLTTDTPTRLVGADADGDLGQVTLGAGLSLASSSLLADTNFLVTRFDTTSMLTNYLRTGVAASTYLKLTGGTLTDDLAISKSSNSTLRLSSADPESYGKLIFSSNNSFFLNYGASIEGSGDGVGVDVGSLNFLTGFGTVRTNRMTITSGGNVSILNNATIGGTLNVTGNVAIGFPFAYKPFEVLSNANDFVSVGVRQLNQFQWSGIHFGYREADIVYRKSAIVFQRNEAGPADASGKVHLLNVNSFEGGRNADLRDAKLTIGNNGFVGINDTSPSFNLDITGTLNATGATTLGSSLTVEGATVFGSSIAQNDFRVSSGSNVNMIFMDASESKVGIGTSSPTTTLDVNGDVKISTTSATPTSLLGKDGSNVVGEVTTVAQTGLMTRGETTATTGSPSAIFTVTHGLGSTPTSVLVTSAGIAGAEKIIFEVYSKNSTTFSVQAWNYDGTEASSKSVKIFWLAIK